MSVCSTILIGLGNEYRQDDGVGIYIVRQIVKSYSENITALEYSDEGVDLIEKWKGYKRAYIFDAVCSGSPPGTIYRFTTKDNHLPESAFYCSTHALSIVEVIRLAQTIEQIPREVIIFGVEAGSLEHGTGLSQEVIKGAKEIINCVIKELRCLQTVNNSC